MRPRRNANRPAGAEIVIALDRLQIVVENLITIVRAVGDRNVSLFIDLESMRQTKLAWLPASPFVARLSDEPAVLIELHNSIVAVSIGHEDVPLRVPTHIRWPAKNVFLRWRVRARSACGSAFN